jgi:hypothetical protein
MSVGDTTERLPFADSSGSLCTLGVITSMPSGNPFGLAGVSNFSRLEHTPSVPAAVKTVGGAGKKY